MLRLVALASAFAFVLTVPAKAAQRHHHGHHYHHRHFTKHVHYTAHHDGRPHAWCGWQMRQWLGGGPEYNLARNWAHWGHASEPHIGAVVVWPHHVGRIVGRREGQWVIESGNDGHRVRSRPRSISGAIAVRA